MHLKFALLNYVLHCVMEIILAKVKHNLHYKYKQQCTILSYSENVMIKTRAQQ